VRKLQQREHTDKSKSEANSKWNNGTEMETRHTMVGKLRAF